MLTLVAALEMNTCCLGGELEGNAKVKEVSGMENVKYPTQREYIVEVPDGD